MLASLLPGLRDVRTPLTVGYLWLVNLWIWFAPDLPSAAQNGDGFVARLYSLGDIFGRSAVVAAVSFAAYLLGAVLTISTEFGPLGRVLGFGDRWQRSLEIERREMSRSDAWAAESESAHAQPAAVRILGKMLERIGGVEIRQTRRDFLGRVDEAEEGIRAAFGALPQQAQRSALLELDRAKRADASELRPRLLVAEGGEGLYGEYDRLSAEAQFRINVAPALLALGLTARYWLYEWMGPVAVALFLILVAQGVGRHIRATSVIQRAVVQNTIEHPMQSLLLQVLREREENRGPRQAG